jgi:hypothetical protein
VSTIEPIRPVSGPSAAQPYRRRKREEQEPEREEGRDEPQDEPEPRDEARPSIDLRA